MSDIPPPPPLPPTLRRRTNFIGSETLKEQLEKKIYEDYKALEHFNFLSKKK